MHLGARRSTILLVVGALGLLPRCTESDAVSSGTAGEGGEPNERGGAASGGSSSSSAGTSNVAGLTDGGADGGADGVTPGAGVGGVGARANAGGEGGATSGHAGSNDSQAGEAGAAGEAQNVGGPRCEAPGQYCKDTFDCVWYSRCEDQHCVVVPEGSPCTGVLDCGKAEYCSEGQCKHRPVTDFDCTDGTAICAPGTDCYWFGYEGGQDPDTRLCVDPTKHAGFCDGGIIPCASSYYCPVDSVLLDIPSVCTKKGGLGDACSGVQPYACAAGLSCNFSKCQPAEAAEGTACELWVSALTAESREYDQRYVQPCAPGLFCKGPGHGDAGECSPQKPTGADCEESFECLHGYCAGTTCAVPELGTQCGYPSYCPAGTTCQPSTRHDTTRCVPTLEIGQACGENITGICEAGSACDPPYGQPGVCRKVAKPGQSCDDAVCSPDAICVADP